MKLSRYCRILERGGICAIFHALKPEPFFIKIADWEKCVKNNQFAGDILLIMQENGLLIESDIDDDLYYEKIKSEYDRSDVMSILYLVLTKGCNMSCKQCFQYERHDVKKKVLPKMSRSIAGAGINSFVRHYQKGKNEQYVPQIIFYGGEPLINWDVLKWSVDYIDELCSKGDLPDSTRLSIVTNGTLICDEYAAFIANHNIGVAVSIDGSKYDNDAYRIYPNGQGTFDDIKKGIHILQKYDADISLSITITPHIMNKLENVVRWAKNEFNVSAIGFNMVGGSSFEYLSLVDRYLYDDTTTNGLIDAFKVARFLGMYEDRIGRKLDSFVNKEFVISDCGAIRNQLVIQPDGNIAFCHASDKYNSGSVFNEDYCVFNDSKISLWESVLLINNLRCQNCYAISTCGYGCFHHVQELNKNLMDGDEQYCLHNLRTFEFMIWDLFDKIDK